MPGSNQVEEASQSAGAGRVAPEVRRPAPSPRQLQDYANTLVGFDNLLQQVRVRQQYLTHPRDVNFYIKSPSAGSASGGTGGTGDPQ